MNPAEFLAMVIALGKDIEIDEEDVQNYFPQPGNLRDFYLPRVPKNFYTGDPQVWRRLVGAK